MQVGLLDDVLRSVVVSAEVVGDAVERVEVREGRLQERALFWSTPSSSIVVVLYAALPTSEDAGGPALIAGSRAAAW